MGKFIVMMIGKVYWTEIRHRVAIWVMLKTRMPLHQQRKEAEAEGGQRKERKRGRGIT